MQVLVEISGVFLSCFSQRPENLILTGKKKKKKDKKKKKSKGFCFLQCVVSDTILLKPYQWRASRWILMHSNNKIIITRDRKT